MHGLNARDKAFYVDLKTLSDLQQCTSFSHFMIYCQGMKANFGELV